MTPGSSWEERYWVILMCNTFFCVVWREVFLHWWFHLRCTYCSWKAGSRDRGAVCHSVNHCQLFHPVDRVPSSELAMPVARWHRLVTWRANPSRLVILRLWAVLLSLVRYQLFLILINQELDLWSLYIFRFLLFRPWLLRPVLTRRNLIAADGQRQSLSLQLEDKYRYQYLALAPIAIAPALASAFWNCLNRRLESFSWFLAVVGFAIVGAGPSGVRRPNSAMDNPVRDPHSSSSQRTKIVLGTPPSNGVSAGQVCWNLSFNKWAC